MKISGSVKVSEFESESVLATAPAPLVARSHLVSDPLKRRPVS